MAFAGLRQFESVIHDAIAPTSGEDCFLYRQFSVRVAVEASSRFGVLSFIVFADNADVDLSRRKSFKWRVDAAEKTHRPQIDVLLKRAPDGNQQPPQRNMIGDSWISDGAKIDGVEIPQLLEAILGHHPASLQIRLATPIKMLPGKIHLKATSGGLENAKTFGHDLVSNAVPFNDCDLVSIHNPSLPLPRARTNPFIRRAQSHRF